MRRLYVIIAATVLLLRLVLASIAPTNFDQDSFQIVAGILQHGGNVYAETARYNYSPLWAYTLLALSGLAQLTHLPLPAIVRILLTLIDGINALLIAKASTPRNGLLYWLNPVSILLVSVHGQFETLALLPILLALVTPRHTWLLGTLSVLVKHLTLPFAWSLLVYEYRPRRAVLALIGSGAIFALTLSPFVEAWQGILYNVILYNSVMHVWGLWFVPALAFPLLAAGIIGIPLYARSRWSLSTSLLLTAVWFLVFTPRIGEQYFLLPILFGSLAPSRGLAFCSVTTTLFLLSSPNNLQVLALPPLWYAVWLSLFVWLGAILSNGYPILTAKLPLTSISRVPALARLRLAAAQRRLPSTRRA